MSDNFKPWRRKMGVLTLLMACAFSIGWVRSLNGVDFLGFYSGIYTGHTVISVDGLLGIQHVKHGTDRWLGVTTTFGDWGKGSDLLLNDLPPSASSLYWGSPNSVVSHSLDSNGQTIYHGLKPGHRGEFFAKSRISWTNYYGLFDFGDYPTDGGGDKFTLWFVPYWSIVIPLTLLSAWLLLSKPKPAKVHESTIETRN
jgi:hypothetical protein